MKWVLKAIIQKTISFLPNSQKVNYWFQKNITKGVRLDDDYLTDRLIHFQKHLSFYKKLKGEKYIPSTVLELGTGWYPVIPICYFLAGIDKIYTVDISPLCNSKNISVTIETILSYYDAGSLAKYLDPIPERVEKLRSIKNDPDLTLLDINYLVTDARNLKLDDDSVEFITSNNTFEHIYPNILKEILVEFKRVLNMNGLMSHFIDMSDHFAHLDSSISIYNFLKYSEEGWRRIDNSVQPQNRWRMIEYRELYKDLGIKIILEENRPGNLLEVKGIKLHEKYRKMPIEEVSISHCYVVS